MNRVLRLGFALCVVTTAPPATAETTVVEASRDDFPYSQTARIYIEGDTFYFHCRDNYLDNGTAKVEPSHLLTILKKLKQWVELNHRVKTKVSKLLIFGVADSYGTSVETKVMFSGTETGDSFISFFTRPSACMIQGPQIDKLIEGLNNNLDTARERESKNLDELFK